nr:MAG: hypothetical protein [Bacteriophage sp.]
MKRYTTRDESAGYISAEDKGLSLVDVYHMTDWTDDQFDKISEMKIGEKLNFDGVTVERDA